MQFAKLMEPDPTIKEPNTLLDLALEQYKHNAYGRSMLTHTQAQQIARIINNRDDPRDTIEHCDSQFWYDPIPESTDDDLHVQEADPIEKGLYAAALNAVLNAQTPPSNMTQGFVPRIPPKPPLATRLPPTPPPPPPRPVPPSTPPVAIPLSDFKHYSCTGHMIQKETAKIVEAKDKRAAQWQACIDEKKKPA
jgi:hypothetical protein